MSFTIPPKLYAIYGTASHSGSDKLMAFISKHGSSHVFGPVIENCRLTFGVNVYTFSFMAEAPTDEQRRFLEECVFDYRVTFEAPKR